MQLGLFGTTLIDLDTMQIVAWKDNDGGLHIRLKYEADSIVSGPKSETNKEFCAWAEQFRMMKPNPLKPKA